MIVQMLFILFKCCCNYCIAKAISKNHGYRSNCCSHVPFQLYVIVCFFWTMSSNLVLVSVDPDISVPKLRGLELAVILRVITRNITRNITGQPVILRDSLKVARAVP